MPLDLLVPSQLFTALGPDLILAGGTLVLLLVAVFGDESAEHQRRIGMLAIVLALVTAGSVVFYMMGDRTAAPGAIAVDDFRWVADLVILVGAVLAIALAMDDNDRQGIVASESHLLILFAVSGMMLLAAARDLMIVFLAVELMSISSYALAGMNRRSLRSAEGALKYFLLGAFSSAFFLYGVAFTYAVVGSTRLEQVAATLASQVNGPSILVVLALTLLLVGFAFKVSAVPFHMWTPDAYEGAPTLVTGFMSTGVKAAAFAAFIRVFLSAFEPMHAEWAPVVSALAVATMVLGTTVGVAQSNVKRMLAYSSIAHGGYLLVGLIAANSVGKAGMLFYLAAYGVTNVAAFGLMALLSTEDHPHDNVRDFAGLWQRRPVLAALMTIFLLSLGGLPPTAGFVAKWYVFAAAVQEGYYALAIIGVLTSVISVYFYLRIVVLMYMSEDVAVDPAPVVPRSAMAGLALATAAIFYLGVIPTSVINLAVQSVQGLF